MTPPPRALCAHILVGFIAKNSRGNLYYHCADFNAFTPQCTIQLFFYTIWLDYIAHDVYNAEKKSYTVIFQGKKISNSISMGKDILTQTKSTIPPSPQKSIGQPHREWGSSGFDTSDVIHQQNGWREFIMWWFSCR